MEKEPILEIKSEKTEKKKKPLGKRMETLKERGFYVDRYKNEEWTQCQVCVERADWHIEGNAYCNRCMSQKVDEFEQAADEIDKKRAEKKQE